MLDWSDGPDQDFSEAINLQKISYAEIISALKKEPRSCVEPKDLFIQDCFDWFFYYLNRIEHSIRTGYIDFIDVNSVFFPYVDKFRANIDEFGFFVSYRKYALVKPFLARYSEKWPSRMLKQIFPFTTTTENKR